MEKKVPEIRFKGFDGEWTSATLGDCFVERIERSADGELLSVTINSGIVLASETGRTDNSSNDKSNYKVVKKGDLAYNSMRMWQGACGHSEYDGIVSPAYTVVTPKDGCNVEYFHYSFKNNDTLYKFRVNSQGLTSDTWNLKYPLFSEIDCKYPSDEDEQKKIASLFKTLDSLIRSLELKLEKLKNIKQSLLNKMFTNGNRGGYEPLIRFKDYNGDWIMHTAFSIFTTFDERNHPELPVLSASQEYGMVIRDNIGFKVQHNVNNEVGYKRVLPGQFVIHLRSFQGGFAHSSVEGITSPAYTIMTFKEPNKHDDYYWKYIFTSKDFIKRLETVTYGIRDGRSISYEDFTALNFCCPDKDEQKSIANIFIHIDKLFRDTQSHLSKVRTVKQSLLQKMFVN